YPGGLELQMKVFITGATGLIGARLTAALTNRGDEVVALSRNRPAAQNKLGPRVEIVQGNPAQPDAWTHAVSGCQAVVNLAGESLFARRWNDDFKKTLHASRVLSTTNLVDAMSLAADPPAQL